MNNYGEYFNWAKSHLCSESKRRENMRFYHHFLVLGGFQPYTYSADKCVENYMNKITNCKRLIDHVNNKAAEAAANKARRI